MQTKDYSKSENNFPQTTLPQDLHKSLLPISVLGRDEQTPTESIISIQLNWRKLQCD